MQILMAVRKILGVDVFFMCGHTFFLLQRGPPFYEYHKKNVVSFGYMEDYSDRFQLSAYLLPRGVLDGDDRPLMAWVRT